MKIVSFNINSIRARLAQLDAVVARHQPEFIGLQETKCQDKDFPIDAIQSLGYHAIFHGQKTHYGVALLSRQKPEQIVKGFASDDENAQRRFVGGKFQYQGKPLWVYNGYFPQGENQSHPTKYPAKARFYSELYKLIEDQHSPEDQVIVMGDLNISATDLDIGIGEPNRKRWLKEGKCSFLPEEREWLARLLSLGLTDSFRALNPEINDRFSWFDYRSRGFEDTPKRGLRIDGILVTAPLLKQSELADIDYEVRGMEKPSDHAPVFLQLSD